MKKFSFFITTILILGTLIFGTIIIPPAMGKITTSSITPYTGYYLASQDEAYGMLVTVALNNGSSGITWGVNSNNGSTVDTPLNVHDVMGFSGSNNLPDWNNNPQAVYNGTGTIIGGSFDYNYTTPWLTTANPTINGPPLFWPVLPYGSSTYWSDVASMFNSNGYSTTLTNNYLKVSLTGTNITDVSVTYDLSTGLMYNYTVIATIQMQNGWAPVDFEMIQYFVLSPSHSSIGYSTYSPSLTYDVLKAGYSNGTTGLDLNIQNPVLSNESGPTYGYGTLNPGDTAQVNVYNYANLQTQGPGYMFSLSTDNANINFQVNLELPSTDPQTINNLFLYPQFPLVNDQVIFGYFAAGQVVSHSYQIFMGTTSYGISYNDGNTSISVFWQRDTGFMQNYTLSQTNGAVLQLNLLAGVGLDTLNLHWGAKLGDANTYLAKTVSYNGTNQIPFDQNQNTGTNTGYLGQGDSFSFQVIDMNSFTGVQNSPPYMSFKISATHGSQSNATFVYPFPGSTQFDGPAMLLPYHLLGSQSFYNWATILYTHAGATYTMNSTNIILNWNINAKDGSTGQINEIWRLSDGAMVYYYAKYTPATGVQDAGYTLEFVHTADGNQVTPINNNSSSLTSPGFSLPLNNESIILGFSFMIAANVIIRKKRNLKL